MGAGVPAWLAWVLLRRMSREFVPHILTGIFEGPFTFKLALLFEIRGTFPRTGAMAPLVAAGRRCRL